MRREEKRKRFHEAVLRTLYPPPSPPDSEEEGGRKPVFTSDSAVNSGLQNPVPGNFGESSSSASDDDDDDDVDDDDDDDGCEAETQKLSRAQRKRLRKKKLKEEAFHRRKIIGPLLPSPANDEIGSLQTQPQRVRGNAAKEQVASTSSGHQPQPGDQPGGYSGKKKVKQRRMAKKLAREKNQIPLKLLGGHDDHDKEH